MQDIITLDYGKWSAQRRQQNLSTDHDLWKQECEAVRARWKRENEEAGEQYRAKLEEGRKAKQTESEAKIDAELEPEKQRIKNEWLANHPGETAADFEKKAWQLIRENLIAQRDQDLMQTEIKAQQATGRYSL